MKIKNLFFVIPTLILVGCNSDKKNNSETDGSDNPEKPIVEEVVTPLPDTMYASVDNVKFTVDVVDSTSGKLNTLKDLYANSNSVMTFRVGAKRQGNFEGKVDTVPTDLVVDWMIETDADRDDHRLGPWGGGTGWTGQPLYVEWPDSLV